MLRKKSKMRWHLTTYKYRPKSGAICVVKIQMNDKTRPVYCLTTYQAKNEVRDEGFYANIAVTSNVSINHEISNVAEFAVLDELDCTEGDNV